MDNIYFREVKRKAVTAIEDMALLFSSDEVIRVNNNFQVWYLAFVDTYPMEYFVEDWPALSKYSKFVKDMCDMRLAVIEHGEEELQ